MATWEKTPYDGGWSSDGTAFVITHTLKAPPHALDPPRTWSFPLAVGGAPVEVNMETIFDGKGCLVWPTDGSTVFVISQTGCAQAIPVPRARVAAVWHTSPTTATCVFASGAAGADNVVVNLHYASSSNITVFTRQLATELPITDMIVAHHVPSGQTTAMLFYSANNPDLAGTLPFVNAHMAVMWNSVAAVRAWCQQIGDTLAAPAPSAPSAPSTSPVLA